MLHYLVGNFIHLIDPQTHGPKMDGKDTTSRQKRVDRAGDVSAAPIPSIEGYRVPSQSARYYASSVECRRSPWSTSLRGGRRFRPPRFANQQECAKYGWVSTSHEALLRTVS